jgi:TolB-like protein/DNA-binding winged helix-turn-helix (wHTH) protein/Tfp pilus assembly protein PilF
MNSATGPTAFRLGVWVADPALDELRCGDKVVKLEPRMMRLLCYLAERPGKVVSPDELLDAVWPGLVVGQNSVYQTVAQLRRLLGDDRADPEYIATVPRKGYRLIAAIAPAEAPSAPSVTAATEAPMQAAPPPRKRSLRRWIPITAVGGLAAFVIGALVWVWHAGNERTVHPRPAIAILPFADLSPAKDNQPFCDGLAEELLNALAQVPELRITARTSAFMFRDRPADVRDIGAKLGVTHVVEGSVRREGPRIRITAQLINVGDGFQVWSNTFDRPYSDVIEIQESIAHDVVQALELKLSDRSMNRLAQTPTPNVGAYELYLLGRFQQQQRKPEAIERAIEYHRQALAIDPNFALAYAGLADASMASHYYLNRPLDEVVKEMNAAITQALAIDPELAEAYAARGLMHTEQFNLDDAVQDLKRAVALKPNYADAYVRLGAAYEYRVEPRAALEAFDQAAALDPLYVVLHVRRCLTLQNIGRYAAASKACERAIELQPDIPNGLWARALIALAQGQTDGAIAGYREALARAPRRTDLLAQLGWLYLDLGLIEPARHSFDQSVDFDPADTALKLERARLFLAGGDLSGLAGYLGTIDLSAVDEHDDLLDAAILELAAGSHAKARSLADRARKFAGYSFDSALSNVWWTRWGRSPALTLAQIELASNDRANAEKHIAAVLDWVERVERNGEVWHGAEYLRASALALRGNTDAAMTALKKARDLGWRRTWWMRTDPALKTLRERPDFVALLRQTDESNAALRQKVLAQ